MSDSPEATQKPTPTGEPTARRDQPQASHSKDADAPKSASTAKPAASPLDVTGAYVSQSLGQTLLLGPQSTSALDLTNCLLGEFRVLRRLGAGGMAQVYLAEQTSLKRNVAIKVMRPDIGNDAEYVQRFEHEAKAAAALNHPNIVQVYNIGEAEGVRFIAQEYVLGMNLKQYITKKRPPSAQVAIHVMKQVCAALQVAHEAGIVHRDIKPENIMITRKHVVKVTDFGLAQLTLAGQRVDLTQQNSTMGTPLYMSPEQVSASKVDRRADLYSLGVAFYHFVAGRPPFQAETSLALAFKHLNEDPVALKQLRPDLPTRFTEIVHKLMAKRPEDRFQDAKSVGVALRQINLADPEEDSEDTGSVVLETTQPWYHIPRKKLIAYFVTCVVLYLMAAGVGRERSRPNPLNSRAAPQIPAVQ